MNNFRLIDYALQKLTANITIHVGGANASDTADINNGRGLSEDKPFATLDAAYKWVIKNLTGPFSVTIQLHSDVTTNGFTANKADIPNIVISSDSTKRTITFNGKIHATHGRIGFYNVKVASGNNLDNFFAAALLGVISVDLIEFSGKVSSSVVDASLGGTIVVYGNPTGTVEGKRFSCGNGGRIFTYGKGPNAIPGTEAGVCDSSSVYA